QLKLNWQRIIRGNPDAFVSMQDNIREPFLANQLQIQMQIIGQVMRLAERRNMTAELRPLLHGWRQSNIHPIQSDPSFSLAKLGHYMLPLPNTSNIRSISQTRATHA